MSESVGLNPSDLNAVARLVMVAERCGSEILDNVDSFDEVFGLGSFARLNCEVLSLARSVVKSSGDGVCISRVE